MAGIVSDEQCQSAYDETLETVSTESDLPGEVGVDGGDKEECDGEK